MRDPRRIRIPMEPESNKNDSPIGMLHQAPPYWYAFNLLKKIRVDNRFLPGYPAHCATFPAIVMIHVYRAGIDLTVPH